MEWIQVTIYTTTAGIEPVVGRLYQLNIQGVEIEDESEFKEHIENNRQYWDYVEEELIERMSGETRVKVYLSNNASGKETLLLVAESLNELKKIDTENEFGRLEYSLLDMKEEDWAENWKQYFKPLFIGEKILIKPEWETIPENTESRIVFTIEPGMVFGTGTHESTKLCIEASERYIKNGDSVLDLGCGSGILSIIALMLGASIALAVDIDPNAVDIAYRNAEMNGIGKDRYTVLSGNVVSDEKLKKEIGQGKYDIIFVNIVADVIIALAHVIPTQLKQNGIMITSGIIDQRSEEVKQKLQEAGLEILEVNEDNGWVGMVCRIR